MGFSHSKSSNDEEVPGFLSQNGMKEIIEIVSDASQQPDGGILSKLSTLSTKLSRKRRNHCVTWEWDVEDDDFDLKTILKTFVTSADEQGIHLRSIGVAFKDLKVKGVDSASSFVPTVLGWIDIPKNIVNGIRGRNKRALKDIIQNVTGVVKPGEMCLVLGRPGAGCSTLLKTIAGEQDQFASVEGDIHYDNIPQAEMLEKYKSDLIYNGELDVHHPHLTVDQTLRFSIGCKTPKTRVNNSTREQYILANRDLLATIFGLRHTYNTKVGNDFVRGVSTGERRRVSIAEAMSCKASVYCWDNATRGLDASTALEYAQAIRIQTSLTESVNFLTMYQAGERIYETFDKVLVLYEGRQVFFGRAEVAKQYFVDMGFECPPRQATVEFLMVVTDPLGRLIRPGFENSVPRTAHEFEQRWLESDYHQALIKEIQTCQMAKSDLDQTRLKCDKSLAQEKKRAHYRYTVPVWTQLHLAIIRGFQKIISDKALVVIIMLATCAQGLVVGSLYYNSPSSTDGSFSRGGMMFYLNIFYCLMALGEVAVQFSERPVLMKQKSYCMFHPSVEVLASALTKFPFKLIPMILFFTISYFLSNLTRDAWRFFLSLFFLVITAESIAGLFQMIGTLSWSAGSANGFGGICLLAVISYSGFMIHRSSMRPWFKWISYLHPLSYGFENLMNNEFHGRELDCSNTLIPSGPSFRNIGIGEQVCAFSGAEPGKSVVNGDNYLRVTFGYEFSHNWRNFGIILGFLIFSLAVNMTLTEFRKPLKGQGQYLLFRKTKETEKIVAVCFNKKSDIEYDGKNVSDVIVRDINSIDEKDGLSKGLGSRKIFAWQNVDFVIPHKGGTRKVLDDIQGYVKPGTLTALMGESGTGKTALLNALAHRIDMGVISGDLFANGAPLEASFKRSVGFVQQQDFHLAELTVRESLIFAARLRRPKSVPDQEKLEYVEKVIAILGMEQYAEAIVGGLGSGLDVEQRKKLSIGVELVTKPSLLLFLDEPTSGLDSQSAWAIINLLQKLAGAGQSILCTIHQPSATLFEAFDRLLLLKKGGQTVYFGDIGKNSEVILNYFERNGARRCEKKENPAEYIFECIGAGSTAPVKEDWFEIWKNSEEYKDTTKEIEKIKYIVNNDDDGLTIDERKDLTNTFAMPYFDQLKYVTMRTFIQFFRSPESMMDTFMLYVLGGLFIGFTFWDIDSSIIGVQNGMFAVFLSIVISTFSMTSMQARAVSSHELFGSRESSTNAFHWSVLLIAQFINEVPYQVFCSTIYFVCLYFPLRVDNTASRAAVFYLNYSIIFQLYMCAFGLAIFYLAPNPGLRGALTAVLLSFIINACGVVQPPSLMPSVWKFIHNVSPFSYVVQTLMGLVLHDKRVICNSVEYSYFNPPPGMTCAEYTEPFIKTIGRGYLKNPDDYSNCGFCPYSVSDQFMETVGVKFAYRWRNFGFMWAYIVFNLVAMCVLYYIFRVLHFNPVRRIVQYVDIWRAKRK